MKKYIPLAAAVVLGLVAVYLIQGYLKKMKSDVYKGMDMVEVLVASIDISKGTALSESNVASRSYPEKYVSSRTVKPEQAEMVMGAKARFNLEKGRPVLWSDIEKPAELEIGIAGLLERGTRAVTIPVTEITGVAHMLRPNHRVDILFTFDMGLFRTEDEVQDKTDLIPEDTQDIKSFLLQGLLRKNKDGKGAAVILRNVLVLATGSSFQAWGILPDNEKPDTYNSVTLMVEENDAALLSYCLDQGKISLLLRNPKFSETREKGRLITKDDLIDFISQSAGGKNP
jgi:Flp pilus assembly protein CpaB